MSDQRQRTRGIEQARQDYPQVVLGPKAARFAYMRRELKFADQERGGFSRAQELAVPDLLRSKGPTAREKFRQRLDLPPALRAERPRGVVGRVERVSVANEIKEHGRQSRRPQPKATEP